MLATLGKLLAGAVAKENPPPVPAALPAGWNLERKAKRQNSIQMKWEAASASSKPDNQGLASKSTSTNREALAANEHLAFMA